MRKLKNGEVVEELDSMVVLLIKTKVPNKYLLIDRETGELYQGKEPDTTHHWKKVGRLTKRELRAVELDITQPINKTPHIQPNTPV
jgi:hypothetical protein